MLLLTALLISGSGTVATAAGEGPIREGGWLKERDEQTGIVVHTMEMTLHPRAEPRPALKYRLLPDEFEMLDGNAAVYYLKAVGFLEQDAARNMLFEYYQTAGERATEQGKSRDQVPPHAWGTMRPDELPLAEVKDFLRLTAFQPRLLKEAAKRRHYDLDRNIREVEDLFGYLLPEVQSMLQLARMQTLRCKVAIAEGRISDALAILGQQYALGRHLGQDDFLIPNLVGIACTGIAWDDALSLVQHPDTPNLYWAFASLPRPLIDARYALAVERQMLYLQLKVLREVDETPRPPGYWQDFLDRLIPQMSGLFAMEIGIPWANEDPETVRCILVGFVAAAYPGAKRYLIEELGLAQEQVEAYPTAQVVFLAMVRLFDEARDEYFKWTYLPFHQARLMSDDVERVMRKAGERVAWSAAPAALFLRALSSLGIRMARIEQQLALVQTVEAIRMYGAAHDGKFPETLDDLAVPAALEPFTGQPLDYQYHGEHAVLNGHETAGLRYRLVLRFAEREREAGEAASQEQNHPRPE
jgi:hypothetical protein